MNSQISSSGAFLLLILAACGPSDERCVPGAALPCVCAGGASGQQFCEASGASYGACECEAPIPDGGVAERDGGTAPRDGGGVDYCAGSPCRNGGTCTSNATDYSCSCAPGYEGMNCAAEIDECAAQPCENGGTCVDGLASFSCNCVGDFLGDRCETHRLEVAHLYIRADFPNSWSDARRDALGSGGLLAEITTPEEQSAVERIARTSEGPLWIGGFQDTSAGDYSEPGGGWRWDSGAPFTYTGWVPGEPNGGLGEDFLEVWGTGSPFPLAAGNDQSDSISRRAIMQFDIGERHRDPESDHVYIELRAGGFTWSAAADIALKTWLGDRRGHLVTIESAAEQAWIERTFLGGAAYWLGARQDLAEPDYGEPAGGWRWINGAPLAFENWRAGQPSDTGGEHFLVMEPDGQWNDTTQTTSSVDLRLILEFEPTTRIDHVAQQDDITHARDGFQPFDPGTDRAYGTAGYVFYCVGNGPPGGPLEWGPAEPLTYNRNGFRTLAQTPAFLSLQSAGQDYVACGAGAPMIDDPRGAPRSNTSPVQSGLAVHNYTSSLTRYASVVDFTITATPPPVFRVGVAIRGEGEDRMVKVRIQQTTGGDSMAVAETVGRPATLFQFFDIENAEVGDTFVVSLEKGSDSGVNPNVAYIGLTFD